MARFIHICILASLPAVLTQGSTGKAVEVISKPNLLDFEKLQLTDKVIAGLKDQKISDLDLFSFGKPTPSKIKTGQQPKCKTYPGDELWPTDGIWKLFDFLLGGSLIKTVPEASICYPEWGKYNAQQCASTTLTWNNSTLRGWDPTSIRSILFQGMTCMPPNYTAAFLGNSVKCSVGGFPEYTVNVSTVAQIQLAVNIARELDIRLVIKNTGHDFGAKSTGKGGLSLWTHYLKDWRFYEKYKSDSYTGPAFRLGAGIQAFEAFELAKAKNVTVVGGEGKVRFPPNISGTHHG